MDKLYLSGLSQVFIIVALAAAKKYSVATESAHLDSTSFQAQAV